MLLQLAEERQSGRIVVFQARRQLVHQPRLHLHQRISITRQGFQFFHLGAIRLQAAQICQVEASRFGEQIGINLVRFAPAALRKALAVSGLTGYTEMPVSSRNVMSNP